MGFAAGFFLFSLLSSLFTETGRGERGEEVFIRVEGREAGGNTCWLEPAAGHAFFLFISFFCHLVLFISVF